MRTSRTNPQPGADTEELARLGTQKYLRNLSVEYRPVSELKPYSRNPRLHSPKQKRQIADSIRQFGFTNPVLLDSDHNVLAGHGRIEAAKLLGLEKVPTILLAELSEPPKYAYILAEKLIRPDFYRLGRKPKKSSPWRFLAKAHRSVCFFLSQQVLIGGFDP